MQLWRIGFDTPEYVSEDLSGEGSKRSGGRWNRPGTAVVYASSSIALACLETLVHRKSSGLPMNRYLVRIDVPDVVWDDREELRAPPVGWDAEPVGRVSLDIGERWARGMSSAMLVVPSAIVPEEVNVLINPAHPSTSQVSAVKVRKWLYDVRLLGRSV